MALRNISRLKKLLLNPHLCTKPRHPSASPSLYSLILHPSNQNPSEKPLPVTFFAAPLSSQPPKNQCSHHLPLTRDGNYEESDQQAFLVCPGCGIHMQDFDQKQPGFYIKPSAKGPNYRKFKKLTPVLDESEISDSLKKGIMNELVEAESVASAETEDKEYGKMPESDQNVKDKQKANEKPIVCARCHSLRHYHKVKDPTVENLLPDFDFNHTVGRRLASVQGSRSVVLLVIDSTDFDGSFPGKVANLVAKTIDENSQSWRKGKPGNVPRILLVVTKIDLLPSSISPTGFEHWVRTRARENGAGKLTSVHLVSSVKEWGVKNLVDDVVKLAGRRGNVWAVGAQNAGKSTLINAIGKCVGAKPTHLTEAPVPGTTLGIVRVEGLLPGKAKLFDTPGLLHPHQVFNRLTMEEQKLIRITKELKPRTYRMKVGYSVHVGGVLRLDVEESSVDSIYVTVWASHLIPLHMGKTENASTLLEDHFGHQLQPPIGRGRIGEIGKWVKREFQVSGNWWDSSSVDIAAAGIGWVAIGLKGKAVVGVWTYEGIGITVRNALLPHRSHQFGVAGFSVSDVVSRADRAGNGKRQKEKKRKMVESREADSNSFTQSISTGTATATVASGTPMPVASISTQS